MINFTDDLLTKHPQIDNQHRELFQRLKDVMAMGGKAVTKQETDITLKLLSDYVKEHFEAEEDLQIKYNYPKYEWHKEQHNAFIDSYIKLKEEYDLNGASAEFSAQLNKSVVEWIIKHIRHADVELGKFLNSPK